MDIEYAAARGDQFSRAKVVARAPAWWRKLADRNLRAAAADKPPRPVASKAPAPVAGWVYGLAVCGVSEPSYAAADGTTLREQFTPAALADIVRQVNGGKIVVPLTWGHRGETIATNRGLDLLLKVDEFYSALELTARLRDTELNRRVLAELERGVLGLSVGYHTAEVRTVDRKGFGPVRIIDRATLHHVALLPRDSKLLPAYRACWASGQRGNGPGCPESVRLEARRFAYITMVAQAKAMA